MSTPENSNPQEKRRRRKEIFVKEDIRLGLRSQIQKRKFRIQADLKKAEK
jgi:hypothetical protein